MRFLNKYGVYIGVTAGILLTSALFTGCSKKTDIPDVTVSYGPEVGFADGNVDLSGDTPVIDISDIKSPVGANIDFLSGVTVANEDLFDDLEVWVDASTVDIFTPGNYTATYTFNYDGKSVSKNVTVTIMASATEQSASDTAGGSSGNTNPGSSSSNGNSSSGGSSSGGNSSAGQQAPPGTTVNTTVSGQTSPANPVNPSDVNSSSEITTTQNTGDNQTTSGSHEPQQPDTPTTTRQIVTTSGDSSTENKNIGNYTIELLSGKTITIKNTTSNYIVSTRTDVTTTTRNNKTYRVSTLVITYNTGVEQILETLEERIK